VLISKTEGRKRGKARQKTVFEGRGRDRQGNRVAILHSQSNYILTRAEKQRKGLGGHQGIEDRDGRGGSWQKRCGRKDFSPGIKNQNRSELWNGCTESRGMFSGNEATYKK